MMIKNILSLLLVLFFVFSSFQVNAIKIVSKEVDENLNTEITLSDMFIYFWEIYEDKIPKSYKYIDVKFKWVSKYSDLYKNIQRLIYLDILDNLEMYLNKEKKISAYSFFRFAEKNYNIQLIQNWDVQDLKSRKATFADLKSLDWKLSAEENTIDLWLVDFELSEKKKIFSDVYNTLSTRHYEKDNLDNVKMIEDATKALAESTWDNHTVYFPPVDNKDFSESLNWEYEWIWAYVDMVEPWIFTIVSPLPWSPAEKAWLKWWDIVTHVDKKEILVDNSIKEIISQVKWPSWTEVLLTIKRWEKIFDLKVERWHIVIKEVESKKLNSETYYIKMKFFWPSIASEFRESLEILKTDTKIKKIIFDLRWNGWGYLDQVSYILWNFIERWEKTAVVRYTNRTQNYYSKWYDEIDFSKYELIALENGWTASASEIFIGTLKDYFPETTIIWENSYGKWSVQTIKWYKDWSSLKYTIAKWYTWKTETWIDWIWIKPDIEIKMEKYWVEEKDDEQLQRAIRLR